MPIHEYSCMKCGDMFEELIFSAKEEKGLRCGKCGSADVKRLMSACSVLGTEEAASSSSSSSACTSCSTRTCSTCK